MKSPMIISTIFSGAIAGAISAFVNDWIFDPAISYFTLVGLIAADHLSASVLAFKHNRFDTRVALRIFWTFLSHTALLMFATNLSKGAEVLFWLNEAVFVPIVLVNLLSLVKNLALLGYIKRGFARMITDKIDVYKNEFQTKKS